MAAQSLIDLAIDISSLEHCRDPHRVFTLGYKSSLTLIYVDAERRCHWLAFFVACSAPVPFAFINLNPWRFKDQTLQIKSVKANDVNSKSCNPWMLVACFLKLPCFNIKDESRDRYSLPGLCLLRWSHSVKSSETFLGFGIKKQSGSVLEDDYFACRKWLSY